METNQNSTSLTEVEGLQGRYIALIKTFRVAGQGAKQAALSANKFLKAQTGMDIMLELGISSQNEGGLDSDSAEGYARKFLLETYEPGTEGVLSREMWELYKQWCINSNSRQLGLRMFHWLVEKVVFPGAKRTQGHNFKDRRIRYMTLSPRKN